MDAWLIRTHRTSTSATAGCHGYVEVWSIDVFAFLVGLNGSFVVIGTDPIHKGQVRDGPIVVIEVKENIFPVVLAGIIESSPIGWDQRLRATCPDSRFQNFLFGIIRNEPDVDIFPELLIVHHFVRSGIDNSEANFRSTFDVDSVEREAANGVFAVGDGREDTIVVARYDTNGRGATGTDSIALEVVVAKRTGRVFCSNVGIESEHSTLVVPRFKSDLQETCSAVAAVVVLVFLPVFNRGWASALRGTSMPKRSRASRDVARLRALPEKAQFVVGSAG